MKLAKKYTHYVNRVDAPMKPIPCSSLEEAKRVAQTHSDIAHYRDIPTLDVCERYGTVVATLFEGNWI